VQQVAQSLLAVDFTFTHSQPLVLSRRKGKNMVQEIVTFIFATKEEAMALANDIDGDVEVHALYVMQGLEPAEKPVGYLVKPAEE
jgi:hypothetical protein